MLQAMDTETVYNEVQSPPLPKGSAWHAAQFTVYGIMQLACMLQAYLFLLKLIPGKNSRRLPVYPKEFVQHGVKNMPLRKRRTQRKLTAMMGVSKTTVHCWIVALTICVHCNSLKLILTEENKWVRMKMAWHFRNCESYQVSRHA